jgi:hypothetical protein
MKGGKAKGLFLNGGKTKAFAVIRHIRHIRHILFLFVPSVQGERG